MNPRARWVAWALALASVAALAAAWLWRPIEDGGAAAMGGGPGAATATVPRVTPPPLRGNEFTRRVAALGSSAMSPADGDYFALRASYPTGRFDPRWLAAAARRHRAMATGVPTGHRRRRSGPSPLALDPDAFTSLGPRPLESDGCQSCVSFGHVAGRTNAILSDPLDPTVAYIGSDGGGVWKTENCCSAATTFVPVTDDPLMNGVAIGDLAFDPNDSDVVYAGTGDLRYGSWSFGSAGVLRSTDAGATWEVLGADVFAPAYPQGAGVFPQYQAIGKVRVDPNDGAKVVVGTKTGVFFSHDGGANWDGPCLPSVFTTQRHDVTGLELIDMGSTTDVVAAVGTRGFGSPVQPDLDRNGANGIYRTGLPASGCPASWTLISRPDNGWPAGTGGGVPYPSNGVGRIDIAVAPSDPDVLYAQVADVTTRQMLGVWRTTDGGATWTERATAADLLGCDGGGLQSWYDQGVTVDPNDPDVLFISTVDLFRSTDGADTFHNVTCGYAGAPDQVHVDHHARTYVGGDSDRLLIGTDGGVYYSANATASPVAAIGFVALNDSLSTLELYSGDITADFADSPTPGITAGAQDNGSSVFVWSGLPGPAEWQERLGSDGAFARIEPKLGKRWYQESQYGNIGVSTTGPFGLYEGAVGDFSGDRKSFLMPYEINKYDCPEATCDQLIAGTYRVWENIQAGLDGSTWYVNSPDLTKGVLGQRSFINQLAFAVSDGSVAIAGTNDGNAWYGFAMGQGTPDSATWVDVTGANAVLPNRPILDVATDPVVPTVGYAAVGGFDENTQATPGHVFRVTCDATCSSFTWEDKTGDLPDVPIDSIAVNPHQPRQVFAGSDWGLYFTDDVDASPPLWRRFTAGLPTAMIWDMAIDRGFTTLAVFTRSRGAFAWPLPETVSIFGDGFESGDTGAWSAAVP